MKRLFVFSLLVCVTYLAFGQNKYDYNVHISANGDSLLYRSLEPVKMKTGKKYPIIIFLHGAGERGNDNEKQLIHGSQMFLNPVNREKYPAFVLFPQCPAKEYWAFLERPETFDTIRMGQPMPPILKSVKELLDSYLKNPMIDKDRVYIIGLSMGGMGTFNIVSHHPEMFAAAIPICGAADLSILPAAKDVNFRIYHGDADNVVPVIHSREAYKTLKEAGADVEYFEFPGCSHGSWNPAFNTQDFMKWLFKQKKR